MHALSATTVDKFAGRFIMESHRAKPHQQELWMWLAVNANTEVFS